jgi:hypothetical protein
MDRAGPVSAPADTRNGWNRTLTSVADWGDRWINSLVGGYSGIRQQQERMGPNPNGYVGDVTVGFVSTIARAGTGLIRAFADPATAARGFVNRVDSILLDDRRAVDVARSNWGRLRSSSAHEIALGTGEVGALVFLVVGPARLGAARMSFGARPSAFANLEPLTAGGLARETFDLGLNSSRYSLAPPRLGGFESLQGTVVSGGRVHPNSLRYVGDAHVYAIRTPEGSLYKIGESTQGVRARDGASIRAEQQARRLFKETGDYYRTEIRAQFTNKADARAYETRFIKTYTRLYGRPPGNPVDR